MRLADLTGEALARADELLDRAAHDVAKYMAITAVNSGAGELDQQLAALLRRDLFHTFAGQPAWERWAAISAELSLQVEDPVLARLDLAMAGVASLAERWTGGEAELASELIARTLAVAEGIKAARREVRARLVEERRR